jgi:hypothetical protein
MGSSILIENGAVLTVDDAGTLHNSGYVFIEDDTLAAVGCWGRRRQRYARLRMTASTPHTWP